MLVGLAVGDALGAPIEFLPEPSHIHIEDMGDKIEHFHENYRAPKGVYTDDTEMALCIADSLLVNKGYDSYDIMRRFTAWSDEGYRTYDDKPACDVGGQTARAIREFADYPVIYEDDPGTDSAGNGAIMRLAPIIIANKNVELIVHMAELSCRETHNSPEASAITKKFAEALYLALHDSPKEEIIKNTSNLSSRILDKDGSKLQDLGGYIVDTFAISLWGLINYDNFKDGMLAVLRLGGDTDTNGACYGQLAGAYYGYKAIPAEWRNGVYHADELVEIADKLLEMPECPILRTRLEDDENFEEPNL